MRWLLALMAMMVAVPASAQESLFPTWLVGRWCIDLPEETIACIRYDPPANGEMRSHHRMTQRGTEFESSDSVIRIESGRVIKRSSDTRFREISRGENEIALENDIPANVARGDARRLTFRVEGDQLTMFIVFADGRSGSQVYTRAPSDADE